MTALSQDECPEWADMVLWRGALRCIPGYLFALRQCAGVAWRISTELLTLFPIFQVGVMISNEQGQSQNGLQRRAVDDQMDSRKLYWRFFNFMARRVLAIWFMIAGTIGIITSVPPMLNPNGTVPVNGVPDPNFFWRLLPFLLGILFTFFGVLLYRARPWYPKSDCQ